MAEITKTPGEDVEFVRDLLDESGLPYQDLTAVHMDSFLLLYNEGRLTGCVGLEVYGDAALLRSLAVQSDQRRLGLGTRLVAAAEELAASRRVCSLFLLTTTAETFFTARGYHSIQRSTAPQSIQETGEFKSLCPSSATCMQKNL